MNISMSEPKDKMLLDTPSRASPSLSSLETPSSLNSPGPINSPESPYSESDTDPSHHLLPPHLNLDSMTYSDLELARDDHGSAVYSSALESESLKKVRRKKSGLSPPPSPQFPPKHKKRIRRKSRASEQSERSRSEHWGIGYTQTPPTGKIFRNLLILEENLRQQAIQQRTLRRKYLTFLAALCLLIAATSYHLYFGVQLATSRVALQLLLLALCVTLLLYHLSGEYQKTIVLPRKFLSSANKGLRQLNARLVKIKTPVADSAADLTREFGLFLCTMSLKFVHTAFPWTVNNPKLRLEVWLVSAQLQCQPRFGLNDVKLVLMPRSFSTDIREGWELYRNEFWINEGMRRRKSMMAFANTTNSGAHGANAGTTNGANNVATNNGTSNPSSIQVSISAPSSGPGPSSGVVASDLDPSALQEAALFEERKSRKEKKPRRKLSVSTPHAVLTRENLDALLGAVYSR